MPCLSSCKTDILGLQNPIEIDVSHRCYAADAKVLGLWIVFPVGGSIDALMAAELRLSRLTEKPISS